MYIHITAWAAWREKNGLKSGARMSSKEAPQHLAGSRKASGRHDGWFAIGLLGDGEKTNRADHDWSARRAAPNNQ